ncbi:D-alanyl-D-alanine carboxypeptidase/D-alanyl-D-alanine endopeptidase [Adhaeribacter swui]|uniref:D-alanyl-D-alanine carboxypeptidase/D-alanyl-D-alanine endopeptidase n=1 Tax=Adhaeribacter swui TaxID=2086471 RepID=UPI001E566D90|nr:D-alanyl-D-alanine carboxypeptidase/D-alanyl-D-alanine-endopeptidase [Adhaeribacter swui]
MAAIRILFFCIIVCLPGLAWPQNVAAKLATAYQVFTTDAQLQSSLSSVCVLDATTGKVIFEKNSKIGLVPASTQKVITSASAYALLGKNFKFQTSFAYAKNKASLLILPSGDPTLGSWRWVATSENEIIKKISQAVQKAGITTINEFIIQTKNREEGTIPDGWIWQDLGNYYGAGWSPLNWRENQFDVILKSGSQLKSPVSIVRISPAIYNYTLKSELTAAAANSGDQAYIYFPLQAASGTIRGTIPVNQPKFKISGAMPDPMQQFARTLLDTLARNGVKILKNAPVRITKETLPVGYTTLLTLSSPPLDSVIYWLNRKSINLYGEALVKTLAVKKEGTGSTSQGLEFIRDFWKKNGIPNSELNMVDGSGLSPLNRVTTQAQVRVLQYALQQPWFSGFYASLPQLNNLKMKSGTLHGAKGFCGYHTGRDGHQYLFSFLVNNYNGSAGTLVPKMYKVLDALK